MLWLQTHKIYTECFFYLSCTTWPSTAKHLVIQVLKEKNGVEIISCVR